jgi:hypothetical protein
VKTSQEKVTVLLETSRQVFLRISSALSACVQAKYHKFRSQDPAQHHWKVNSIRNALLDDSVSRNGVLVPQRATFRSTQVLAAFVESLKGKEDRDMVDRHVEWEHLVRAERKYLALREAERAPLLQNRGGPAETSHPVRTLHGHL